MIPTSPAISKFGRFSMRPLTPVVQRNRTQPTSRSISSLRRGRLHVFDSYLGDTVCLHLFDRKSSAAVVANIADCWNLLQSRKHEAGQGLKAGLSRQQQIVLRLQIAKTERPIQNPGLSLA